MLCALFRILFDPKQCCVHNTCREREGEIKHQRTQEFSTVSATVRNNKPVKQKTANHPMIDFWEICIASYALIRWHFCLSIVSFLNMILWFLMRLNCLLSRNLTTSINILYSAFLSGFHFPTIIAAEYCWTQKKKECRKKELIDNS